MLFIVFSNKAPAPRGEPVTDKNGNIVTAATQSRYLQLRETHSSYMRGKDPYPGSVVLMEEPLKGTSDDQEMVERFEKIAEDQNQNK